MSRRYEVEEVADDRRGYRKFSVVAAGRRFSVLHTPHQNDHQPDRTLISNQEGDRLWPDSHHLAIDGHVSALACIDMIERSYAMARVAQEIGYEKRASEIRAALGL